MKFLLKEISPSKTEVRLTLDSILIQNTAHYVFGGVGGNFDEGTMNGEYIPHSLANYISAGPNPGVIRLIVAFLKDTLGTPSGYKDTLLISGNVHIPIVNIAVDDINLITLNKETIPSVVIKLAEELPSTITVLSEVSIEKQILTTQEQDVYYVPKSEPPLQLHGLAYDIEMKDEVDTAEVSDTIFESFDEVSGSLNPQDKTVIHQIISGSDPNLNFSFGNYENFVHFGSAVSMLDNFVVKVKKIEDHLETISQSLQHTGSTVINGMRTTAFTEIQKVKDTFTPYEWELYYKGADMGHKYPVTLGKNYADITPLNSTNTKILTNHNGFEVVYYTSGSISSSKLNLFSDKYNAEDKPFFNYSGSLYLSFLMTGDESINTNLSWSNSQEEYVPKLPHDSLYTSSIANPEIKSGSWQRYIFQASASYWTPYSGNPVIGYPGGVTDFTKNSTEVSILSGSDKSGSHTIIAGGRYSNLATSITSSGVRFTGSMSPAGELFNIFANTNKNSDNTAITSSYITDVRITEYHPTSSFPFGRVFRTGSVEFQNWYNDQYDSASYYDIQNVNKLVNNLPEYLQFDGQMDHGTLRKFNNLTGEYFDLIKNYIDNFSLLYNKNHDGENMGSATLLPVLSNQHNWELMLPFGNVEDTTLSAYLGSTIDNLNKSAIVKDNIWRNILASINYMYKTKGTHNSIIALLNAYGFPSEMLRLREHGGSTDSYEDSILADNTSNLPDGLESTTGSLSFTSKKDKFVSYIIDSEERHIKAKWGHDEVSAAAVEFVFRPSKSTNTQMVLVNHGHASSSNLWNLQLQPSASSDEKARLQFQLSNANSGSLDINTTGNRISMSTDYISLRNQNHWNVLLERLTGPSGSDTYTSHSYRLSVGEQVGDKIRTLSSTTMNYGGNVYSHSAANWNTTHSSGPTSNLVFGGSGSYIGSVNSYFTGSIAEIRTWQHPLSMSSFKQHIYDKKNVVGNSITASRNELIYHYRLNENWPSGSSSPTVVDTNPGNLKDYSIAIPDGAFGGSPLYFIEEFDRIMFGVRANASFEQSENHILIEPERRHIGNLHPNTPSFLNVSDPLIDKRRASSVIELVRSPQDVINDFILNQLGNFDFNDRFADPQDIYNALYGDLEKFAKDFFDYYNISMDVNKYIRAQAALFNKDFMKSLRRLVPARAEFSKVGIELKPTFLERQKVENHHLSREFIDIGPQDIKLNSDNTTLHDWEKNIFSGLRIDNLKSIYERDNRSTHIEITSHTGSVPTWSFEREPRYLIHFNDFTHTSSVPSFEWEVEPRYKINFDEFNVTSSVPTWSFERESRYKINFDEFNVTSSVPTWSFERQSKYKAHLQDFSPTGSVPTWSFEKEPRYKINFDNIFNHTSSVPSFEWEVEPRYKINFDNISNYTSSVPSFNWEQMNNYQAHIEVASHTGSIPIPTAVLVGGGDEGYWWTYCEGEGSCSVSIGNIDLSNIVSATGSVPEITAEKVKQYTYHFDNPAIVNHSSSIPSFDWERNTNYLLNFDNIANHTSSIPSLNKELFLTKNTNIEVSSHTGSIPSYKFSLEDTKDAYIEGASSTASLIPQKWSIADKYIGNLDTINTLTSTTGSMTFDTFMKTLYDLTLVLSNITSSRPEISMSYFGTKDGIFHFSGEETLGDKEWKSFTELGDKWGTTENDIHFISDRSGSEGKDDDYNTYHYEKRYIFHMIGDVEVLSGSHSSVSSSFETDYFGTITNNIHTASQDFYNQTNIDSDIFGSRPLGMTVGFKPSSSISFKGGKFIDENFVYPANHQFIVGTTKDNINSLIYKGTQNTGDIIESEEFTDLSEDAFYYITTTGGSGYTISYDS